MTTRNIILSLVAFWLLATGTLIYCGECAARRGAAQVPSIEIVP